MGNEARTLKKANPLKRFFAIREATVGVIIIAIAIILTFATPNPDGSFKFINPDNIQATAMGLSADGIIAIAMTFVLVTGGIDLSVGSIFGLTAMTAAVLSKNMHCDIWIAVLIAIIVALAAGAVNGFFITKVKLSPFITTLGMMSIARGLAQVISKGSTIAPGESGDFFRYLGSGIIGFIPMFFIIFIVMAVIADILLRKSVPIRKLFYTGSNKDAAKLSGINTNKVEFITYLVTGLLCGISGILYLSRFNVAVANAGTGAEMRVIAACVIGGSSLTGGEGTVLGTVLGVILLNIINNGLVLLNVSVYYQDFISGIILLLAVTLDAVTHMKRR